MTRRQYLHPDRYLTLPEVKQLLHTLDTEAAVARRRGTTRALTNRMLVVLMLRSGLRATEVCYLRLRDLPTYHGKDVVFVSRSGAKYDRSRTVQVTTRLRKELADYVRRCRKGAKPGSPLFVNREGFRQLKCHRMKKHKVLTWTERTSRLSYHALYLHIKGIGRRAGLLHVTPHVLRHTFATHAYTIAKDLRLTQEQLGHSRSETTEIYAGVLDQDRRNQAKRLFEGLFEAPVGPSAARNGKNMLVKCSSSEATNAKVANG